MIKKYIFRSVFLLIISIPSYAINEGTAGITGQYTGAYHITMLGCPGLCSATSYITLGYGIKDVEWLWNFDEGTAEIEGTTLSVGFDYEVQDVGNEDSEKNIVYFTDNGDGTYTLGHGFQIYNPNVGSPRKETSTTFMITKLGNELKIETIDIEKDGSQDGVPGTQITDVFPMTIAPVMDGWARLNGSDSTGDGISDSDKIILGLNPDISDTDGDGIDDVDELGIDFKNPLDTDNDGVIDALEPNDSANNSQQARGLPLLSGVAGLVTTVDELSGETVDVGVTDYWELKNISSDLMVIDTDSASTIEDAAVLDSTLGAPGLNYIYGQVVISAFISSASSDENFTVQLHYSATLPHINTLLVYTLEIQNDGKEIFTLLPNTQWNLIDEYTLEIVIPIASKRNLAVELNSAKLVVAPVENSLGGIDRNQAGGGIGWEWLILLILIKRKYRVTSQLHDKED